MVNRTMQQKVLKIKKQRRAWARPLSIKSGIRPNFDVIRQYKQSAKGLEITDQEADELYRRLFKRDPWKGKGPARLEVLRVLVSMREQTPDFLFFTLHENNFIRVRVYFNSLKTRYFVMEEDFVDRVIRRSIVYETKDRATTQWHCNRIVWVEKSVLPAEIPDS